ncbi:MAG: transcription-repair coupling factor [Bacteroidales bacterium]|nr:transcription-repair coupling factor [Bacteroidales bacterium]
MLEELKLYEEHRIQLKGLVGSSIALVTAAVFKELPLTHLFILPDKESCAYFFNDLENIFGEQSLDYNKKKILFYPASYKRPYEADQFDSSDALSRTEVMNRINSRRKKTLIVTYPEALCERVVNKKYITENTLSLHAGEAVTIDFIVDLLMAFEFERVDFVVEPGQFSLRGGIVDVFSFSNDYPYRIEFFGDSVESIRAFDPASQLSLDKLVKVTIVPNIQSRDIPDKRESFMDYIPSSTILWTDNIKFIIDKIDQEFVRSENAYKNLSDNSTSIIPSELFITGKDFLSSINKFSIIETAKYFYFEANSIFEFEALPQPSFNKNFDLLISNLDNNSKEGISNLILTDNAQQLERLYAIIEDTREKNGYAHEIKLSTLNLSLHEGFIDNSLKIACYTDHQIFERFHRFHLRDRYNNKEALTIKEMYNLNQGDYVSHIDHGIGRFDGLEKIINNGREQEAIRLIYQNNDLLYVSIHSLHRIAKYIGKEGTAPPLNRLGSNAWNKLKSKTKNKVKDIAKDLIKLYASRKATKGLKFSPDSYLQHELEASFIYEDTPDQLKATVDVKKDLEAEYPMDRLICGDVGFGKTEIAIRAAFKTVAESKQVALLVPTTILALQHYNTFRERLKDFPCNVDYINRFKSAKAQKKTLEGLQNGKIDIIIGTHRIASKDIEFKDLGLLIIDEEQKFGVAVKEKLKQLKVNVDTLILTATPIPRTMQFSLMGARDLSIINTAPPNRHPIQTELHMFGEEVIKNALTYELSRGGQVYFVHNRIQNIMEVAEMLKKFCPKMTFAIAHGQLPGTRLEGIMLDFIDGRFDVLIATTIIESGLDIPNVNTIIINEAQNYGLSDLHQLRGRVGRANKKAFCYLLTPPLSILTDEARKRLKAIEEFSDLGSGFNIAMRDLDIRGAGNILGAEQSGFISDIGFEMYHKILNEAIMELKESEFKDLYEESAETQYVKNCQLETDLELLIPDDYISNITARLSLYKELDNIDSDENLVKFKDNLNDRFGQVPDQTSSLINTIRLRWIATAIGFEKLVLKSEKLIGYFIKNQESPYFQTEQFSRVLQYLQENPYHSIMKEQNNKLSLVIDNVISVNECISVLSRMRLHDPS